jgi:hypothetical protein
MAPALEREDMDTSFPQGGCEPGPMIGLGEMGRSEDLVMAGDGERWHRRPRRDAAHPPGRPSARKVKRTIVLTREASRRLDVHAVGMGLDVSAVVEQLVEAHCRRFVLTDRGGGEAPPAGEGIGQAESR